MGLLTELYADVQPHGWRLVDRPGADHRRAVSALSSDVGVLADVIGEAGVPAGALKLQLLGPLSLAAAVSLHHGEKVLSDAGARRDLAESLADGAAGHLRHVQRATGSAPLSVVVEDGDSAGVLGGTIPTASGYQSLRALPRHEATGQWAGLVRGLRDAGAETVVLRPGTGFPSTRTTGGTTWRELVGDALAAGFDTVMLPFNADVGAWERMAELVDQGGDLWVEALAPGVDLPGVTEAVQRIHRPWQMIGVPDAQLGALTLLPAPGLERGTPEAVRRTLHRLTQTADALDQLRVGG